jgi:transglutaminase-like putative cysteine protease
MKVVLGEGATCLGGTLLKQGWLGIDPTNNIWTMENHVKLSVGLNFSECTPIKGTFKASLPINCQYLFL